jgi:3-keto-disaccharide hydrolase
MELFMKTWPLLIRTCLLLAASQACYAQVQTTWKIHDPNRPLPAVIDPGTSSTQDSPGRPPSDAVVLFDGKDLSHWSHKDGSAAKWKVENGYAEVAAKTGYIYTREGFGDCQLHVEFAEPVPPKGESQERGNSGVFLMGLYEIQVLDSYENKTYADGQASAVYGQYPPLVNAARPPGQWQSYDILFHGPRFDKDGKLTRPARVTVLHNGVLVQDNVELSGPTAHGQRPPYKSHAEKLPLGLQDHGNPVRYRNIWIRELN